MDKKEKSLEEVAGEFDETIVEFNPEKNEEYEKLRQIAVNIIDCFDWQPNKEGFLVVTDTRVIQENPLMLRAIEYELKKRKDIADKEKIGGGASCHRVMVAPFSSKSATPFGETIGEALRNQPVLIITAMPRSHSKETGSAIRGDSKISQKYINELLNSENIETLIKNGFSGLNLERLVGEDGKMSEKIWQKFQELVKKNRVRLISITKGHNPFEILTKGAVFESVEKIRERADKVQELMKDVKRVHITSPLGTNLWLNIRPDLTEVEDGRVDKPGKLSNYPVGEWACSPDWSGSDGVMIVDGPCGGNINQHIIDRGDPLRLIIKNGEIIDIQGGEEAETLLKAYLDSGNNDKNHAYKLAELGIGINAKALEGKPRECWGSTEGEKKYGTVHVAVGSNGSMGRKKDDQFFNAAEVHCDMVLGLNIGGEATVECERGDGSTFILIKNGQPVGY